MDLDELESHNQEHNLFPKFRSAFFFFRSFPLKLSFKALTTLQFLRQLYWLYLMLSQCYLSSIIWTTVNILQYFVPFFYYISLATILTKHTFPSTSG